MFGIGRSSGGLDTKTEKKILDDATPPIKRLQYLSKFTENSNEVEVKPFYSTNYSKIYKIFLDALLALDSQAKASKNKPIATSDILSLCNILYTLFKHARNIIQKKWQQRSIIHYLECFLNESNTFVVKKRGMELLLLFLDIMQDGVDTKVIDLLMNVLKFEPFVEGSVKLPTYEVRDINDDEKLKIATETSSVIVEVQSLELFTLVFSFIKTNSDQFEYWWPFFKARFAPILYPNECKSLELLNKLDDMGFIEKCPYKIHLLVLDMILNALETPKKSEILYQTDKDIYMFLLIFRQSFMLPPQHYDSLSKMLKTYRSWICKDYFMYDRPDIMERSRNTYFRVFIDNLAQVFYMEGDEAFIDIHLQLCYEALDIFIFFTSIPDKVEFETWNDLLSAHLQIAEHLIVSGQNQSEHQLAKYLEKVCVRNLFVLWMRVHPDDEYVDLWNGIYELTSKYMGVASLFDMWKNTVMNLTRVIVHRIFGLTFDLIDADFNEYTCELYELEKKSKKWKVNTKNDTSQLMSELFLKLNEGTILHLFHKMINMYGSNSSTLPADLHIKKIKVVSEMVHLYLSVSQKEVKAIKGTTPPPFLHSPEDNKIMSLFLEWLIEGCTRADEGFSEGRYIAYVSLCNILCQKGSQPIEKKYLAHSYRVLHIGLTSILGGTSKTVAAIFLNAKHFFSYGHQGANLLIPDFLESASKILKESQDKNLRISAINVLLSIICICYFYDQGDIPDISSVLKTQQIVSDESSPKKNSFNTLRTKICQMMMLAVVDDQFSEVQIKCLWGLYTIVHKRLTTFGEDGSSVKFIIDSILGFICHKDESVAQAAQDSIISMAHMDLFPKLGDTIMRNIVVTLCDNLTYILKLNNLTRAKILKNLFYALVEVLPNIPSTILDSKDVSFKLFNCIQLGLSVVPLASLTDPKFKIIKDPANPNTPPTEQEKIHEVAVAAEVLLSFSLNVYGQFPCPNGSARMSSALSEFDLLEEGANGLVEPSPKVHHFIFNDYTLLTVMESPTQPECCRIIVRDMTGKYCWEQKMVFSNQQATFKRLLEHSNNGEPIEDDEQDTEQYADSGTPDLEIISPVSSPRSTELVPPTQPFASEDQFINEDQITTEEPITEVEYCEDAVEGAAEIDYPHYDPDIDTDKTDMLEILQHYVAQVFPECDAYALTSKVKMEDYDCDTLDIPEHMEIQTQSEIVLLEQTEHLPFPPVIPPQKQDPMDLIVFKAFRALLNNIGYLNPATRNCFSRLDANHKFYRTLKQFDKIGERETIKIGVIYVGNDQDSARDLIKAENGSDLYKEFVQGLGWEVDLKTHVGFMGGLDSGLTTGLTAPYYANATTETIFHVVTNMPTKPNDQQQIHKKRHIGNDIVHIVWSEHDRDYRPWTITSQFNFVHIVVSPLKDPFYRIQIFTKPEVPLFGPLTHGMIVDKMALAPLVRMTAINANKAVRYSTEGYNKPYPTRRAYVNEISERFKMNNVKNEDFLKPLFFDQIYSGLEEPKEFDHDNLTTEVDPEYADETTEMQ